MPLNPLHHYAFENPASVYDEEALTALELCARLGALLNECIRQFNILEGKVNQTGESVPQLITSAIGQHMDKVAEQLKEAGVTVYNPITLYGCTGDGVTDDTQALNNIPKNVDDPKVIDLLGKNLLITGNLELKGLILQNGVLTYTGPADQPIITMLKNSGLVDMVINVETPYFSSDVVKVDYTDLPGAEQWAEGEYIISGLTVNNTDLTQTFQAGSSVVHILYDRYQVITCKNIHGLRFNGKMENGIFINPQLRDEKDNPVYNTAVFENVFFHSVNCALRIEPTMLSGDVENSKGGIGLHLIQYANQWVSGITSPFIVARNANLNGDMVIPWDYYNDGTREQIPDEGTFKLMGSSTIHMDRDYFPGHFNPDVHSDFVHASTGETYSTLPAFKAFKVGNNTPERSTGTQWGVDAVKPVVFTPTSKSNNYYSNSFLGLQFMRNNQDGAKGGGVYQIGYSGSELVMRTLKTANSTTGPWEWGPNRQFLMNGAMPFTTVYSIRSRCSKEPTFLEGLARGDMYFFTDLNLPLWYNGSEFIDATGTVRIDADKLTTDPSA